MTRHTRTRGTVVAAALAALLAGCSGTEPESIAFPWPSLPTDDRTLVPVPLPDDEESAPPDGEESGTSLRAYTTDLIVGALVVQDITLRGIHDVMDAPQLEAGKVVMYVTTTQFSPPEQGEPRPEWGVSEAQVVEVSPDGTLQEVTGGPIPRSSAEDNVIQYVEGETGAIWTYADGTRDDPLLRLPGNDTFEWLQAQATDDYIIAVLQSHDIGVREGESRPGHEVFIVVVDQASREARVFTQWGRSVTRSTNAAEVRIGDQLVAVSVPATGMSVGTLLIGLETDAVARAPMPPSLHQQIDLAGSMISFIAPGSFEIGGYELTTVVLFGGTGARSSSPLDEHIIAELIDPATW